MDFVAKPPCVDGYEFNNTVVSSKDKLDEEMLYENSKCMIYTRKQLEGRYIEEAMGDDYLNWNNQTPVLIDAPTGSGKSTFICQKLIREAASKNATLLLVSNRAALVRQQKMKVAKVVAEYDPYINPNPEDTTIDEYVIWGNVCICTYHGLPSLLKAAEYNPSYRYFLSRLMYTVCDEIHFLYADAVFAQPCSELLEKIPAYFYHTIRIYMTATSWSVQKSLIKAEENVGFAERRIQLSYDIGGFTLDFNSMPSRHKFLHYTMPANYNRYNLHFFSASGSYNLTDGNADKNKKPEENTKEEKTKKKKLSKALESLIKCVPQPTSTNKLLVFVRRREDGRNLESTWKEKGVNAVFIDRTSKNAPDEEYSHVDDENADKAKAEQKYKNKVWKQLLRNEKFDEDVLISTSVLDCGINILDDAVRTVACFADEPTAFIQMLGRKRVPAESTETIDVWVYVPTAKHFMQIAEMKKMELDLAERLAYIRYFQESQVETKLGNMVPWVSKNKSGQIQEIVRDDIQIHHLSQHTKKLSLGYSDQYEGADFRELYFELWSSYSRISDKRLFYFDNFGQPYVNDYVKWVVEEQKRYYLELAETQDYRLVVSSWMGKDVELTVKREEKKQELISFLESHCQCLISEDKRDYVRSLIAEVALLYFDDNSMIEGWHSMTPKRLNPILESLDVNYRLERAPGTSSKGWKVI